MKENFIWVYNELKFGGLTWRVPKPDRVMVIVHGIGEHIGRYDEMARFFNQHNFSVIGIDHYGHGKSPGKRGASKGFDFSFDYLTAFLNKVKQQFQKPIILYGHSMGGGMVTGFVLKRVPPIEAVIISSPALLTYKKVPKYLLGTLAVLNKLIPDLRVEQGLDIQKSSHDPKAIAAFQQDTLNHSKMSIRLAYTMVSNGFWCLEHARELKIPALLIHGDADEFTSVEGSRLFAKRVPQQWLTYKEWPGGYHELHNEPNKMEVFQAILDWLKKPVV